MTGKSHPEQTQDPDHPCHLHPAWPPGRLTRSLRPGSDLSIPLSNLPTFALICSNIAIAAVAPHTRVELRSRPARRPRGPEKEMVAETELRHCFLPSPGAGVGEKLSLAAATLPGCHVTSSQQAQSARAHTPRPSRTISVRKSSV